MSNVAFELNGRAVPTKKGNSWTARAVRDILQNEIYYAVAGVSDEIGEYRILDEGVYQKATKIRFRFQNRSAERPNMDKNRKEQTVERVLKQYQSYLERI